MRVAPPMSLPVILQPDAMAAAERVWWANLVRSVLEQCGLDARLGGERFDAFFGDLYDHFTTAEAWRTYPDVQPTLERLKRSSVVVGLITNYDTRVYRVLDALGLSTALDSVTIPATAGAAKPARAIFEYALRQHGLSASEAVYVGDEIGDDYEGAEGAGMRAVLIDREGTSGESRLTTITDLTELAIDD
jgi:putative hydrolase of the HAD superfamily